MKIPPDLFAKNLFIQIAGLSAQKAEETMRNKKLTSNLLEIIDMAKNSPKYDPSQEIGKLLYSLASNNKLTKQHKETLIDCIVSGQLLTVLQLEAASEFLSFNKPYSQSEFNEYAGINITVTAEELSATISELISELSVSILDQDYKSLLTNILKKVKSKHKWGSPVLAKTIIEKQLDLILGPKPENPVSPKPSHLPYDKEKLPTYIGRELRSAQNSEELKKKHLEFSKGKIITRFPPEPNGYLHIGHAKAMRFSFKMAEESSGLAYLRFDDTNPEKESLEYISSIKENVSWLGYSPWKTTHASEYFPQMYGLALELIRKGKAYVDQQPWDLIKEQRASKTESPYRNSTVEENLEKFEKMRKGFYAEGEACLRMKIDMANPNPSMRDPVAYRVKHTPHPHVGDQWCVYPTYDFEHCIVDSLENITHSLCTLEFEIRRDPYYWLLEALDLYRASVWEYSRLNISQTVMSKRKLQKLVDEKLVKGWDDPRLPTINGLRRRGYTPRAINEFVDTVGVARTGNENLISVSLLEHCIRKELDETAPRTMAIVDPLLVNLLNAQRNTVEIPVFPKCPDKDRYCVEVGEKIYIEKSDFQESGNSEFFGLSLNQTVRLKYLGVQIRCVNVIKECGKIVSIDCEIIDSPEKPRGVLHWLPENEAVLCEVRLYDHLFKSMNPSALEDWVSDINPNSLTIMKNSLIHKSLLKATVEEKFQFERLGYFVVDPDSTANLKIFNRIVSLVESKKRTSLSENTNK